MRTGGRCRRQAGQRARERPGPEERELSRRRERETWQPRPAASGIAHVRCRPKSRGSCMPCTESAPHSSRSDPPGSRGAGGGASPPAAASEPAAGSRSAVARCYRYRGLVLRGPSRRRAGLRWRVWQRRRSLGSGAASAK